MKLLHTICLILIAIGLLFSFVQEAEGSVSVANKPPMALDGYLDTSGWDFERDGLLKLNGSWEFYWLDLIEPGNPSNDFIESPSNFIDIPSDWTRYNQNGEYLPADGYATLRLKVRVDDVSQVYGLKIRYMSSAMKLWVNGKLVQSVGQVGINPDEYIPRYLPAETYFTIDAPEIDIVIQVANYTHRRVKLNEVYFGTEQQINDYTSNRLIKASVIFGSLLLISFYYFIIYFIQRMDKAALYFAVFSLIVALRNSVMSERILTRLVPDVPAEIVLKIGYLPVFILLPLIILYIREIFYSPTLDKAATISKYTIMVFSIMVIMTTVTFYDWMFQYVLLLIFAAAVFMIYILIVEGFFQQIRGAWIMAVGCVVILITAINDYLSDLHIIRSPELLSTGVLIFIVLQAIFLAWRFNDSYIRASRLAEENETMYEELQELNEKLEMKVKDRTQELEMANRRLEQISRIDALTSLANRRSFDERILEEWKRAIREKETLSMIMIDIDCFKQYNDNYGHIQGDVCLQQIAGALTKSLSRGADFVARYGGEEFAVLLPNTTAEGAIVTAESIRENIEALRIVHEYSEVSEYVTVSCGVNTISATLLDSMEEFINKADKALYQAKETGRNRVVHADYKLAK